jgi:hypothetical protein
VREAAGQTVGEARVLDLVQRGALRPGDQIAGRAVRDQI